MFNLPFLPPSPLHSHVCMYCVWGCVCAMDFLLVFAHFVPLIQPAPVRDSVSHTHTRTHGAVCGYNFSIIVEFLLIFFFCFCFFFRFLIAPLSYFVAFAAAYLASGQNAIYVRWLSVERFCCCCCLRLCFASCFSDFVLCSSAFIATCHLRDLRLSQQANQTKPRQATPSQVCNFLSLSAQRNYYPNTMTSPVTTTIDVRPKLSYYIVLDIKIKLIHLPASAFVNGLCH